MDINGKTRWFLTAELGLYLTFLAGDLLGLPTDRIKFASIVLCVLAVLGGIRHLRERFVPAALLLTLAADVFLLWTDAYLAGVLLFCIVQSIYAARLMYWRAQLRHFRWTDHLQSVTWRLFLYGMALVLLRLFSVVSVLAAAALRSFTQLTVNMAEAWQLRREAGARMFALGLSLFWACDLCVGLRFVWTGSDFSAALGFLIWLFYVPAQVCLVLSGLWTAQRRI